MVSATAIGQAVARVASTIADTHAGDTGSNLLMLVLLEGARPFARDLCHALPFTPQTSEIRVSSYQGVASPAGQVRVTGLNVALCAGRDILIVDDIYDSGRTLAAVSRLVRDAGARSVKTCVMFTKRCARTEPAAIDFSGIEIDDVFVVGYGLDYYSQYRELDYVAQLIPLVG